MPRIPRVSLSICPSVQLCERGYPGTEIYAVRKGFGISGGDLEGGSGRGSRCSESLGQGARYIADENFIVRHSAPGVVSMASPGVHKVGSAFFIATSPQPQMGEWPDEGWDVTTEDDLARPLSVYLSRTTI